MFSRKWVNPKASLFVEHKSLALIEEVLPYLFTTKSFPLRTSIINTDPFLPDLPSFG